MAKRYAFHCSAKVLRTRWQRVELVREGCSVTGWFRTYSPTFDSLPHNVAQVDALGSTLRSMLVKAWMQRADCLQLVRRTPAQGDYHLTFLVMREHLLSMGLDTVHGLVVGFLEQVGGILGSIEVAIQGALAFLLYSFCQV
jgi:hypothetical protein